MKTRDALGQFLRSAFALIALIILATPVFAESALLTKVRAGDDVKIALLGTSLTSNGTWPAALQGWLSAESPGPGRVTVTNHAASGQASDHGLAVQTPAALADLPDAVLIEFAMNDAATTKNITLQQSEDNLNAIIDQFVTQAPGVIIVLQTMNTVAADTSPFSPRPSLAAYYQVVRDVATARGAILIDHYPNWLDLFTNDLATWNSYMTDAVHPNPLGQDAVLFPELQAVLGPPATPPTDSGSILFRDDFSGPGSDPLHGTTPDVTQGTTAWVADLEYKADGSAASGQPSRRAYLSLGGLIDGNRGNPDALYTLSGTIDVSAGSTGFWEALGFWDEDSPGENFGSTPSDGVAWMLRRDRAELRVFRGPRTANGITESTAAPNNVAGAVDLKVVVDLTDWNGTDNWGSVTYFAKLSSDATFIEVATGELNADNATFRAVGLGGGPVDARVNSFELSKSPPPPAIPLRLAGFSVNPSNGEAEVSIVGDPETRYELAEADDLDFSNPDRAPVPLTGASAGTREGDQVITDPDGTATVSFNLGTQKPATFIRAQTAGTAGPRYYQPAPAVDPVTLNHEVAVYGGTPAGVTAAIQAARMGKSTVLLSFNRHVGGLTSGGLTATDLGDQTSIGGIAHEFYQVVGFKDFRPSVAEARYLAMLDEAGVTVLFGRCLRSVAMQENHIVSATMETGETIAADMFIDATYEGDLLAAANVSYHVGREPVGTYNESLAGQWQQVSWAGVYQFCDLPISPYVVDGDAGSGLLPEIMTAPAGNPGDGDYRVQAYNFRMHLSNAAGRIPFPEPAGYEPARYGLLARFLNEPGITWKLNYTTAPMTDGPVQMRNGDSNNAGSFSSDYVGGSNFWPDGTHQPVSFAALPAPRRGLPVPLHDLYVMREAIFQDHVRYQQGLMYFLANDPQVPAGLQDRVNAWGLRPDEFVQTAHWPHQLYVREGRRMVSDYIMTQANCESTVTVTDSVGLASYAMDSHFCQRVLVEDGGVTTVRNEGGFGKACPQPYPVSYRSILPTESECDNLLVPVSLSASHVAFGSIRMEPVFMILGQSAGTAAALAIDDGIAVQSIDYAELRQRLEEDGQKL